MAETLTREAAWALLTEYNKELSSQTRLDSRGRYALFCKGAWVF